MLEISEREQELPKSMMADIMELAATTKLLSLGPGEPDFTPPPNVIRFAKKQLDAGYTHYSPPGGRPELKAEICKKLKRENKIDANPENVLVSCGSTEAILLAFFSVLDVGDNVLVQNPGFLSYRPSIELLSAFPVSINLKEDDDFALTSEKIRDAIQTPEKTKVLMLNTPANPTGVVYSKKLLEEIADMAIEYDFYVFSDEAYEKFVYGGEKHVSIGSLNGMKNRVISFYTFSKTYAMPGFRVGYAVAPKNIIEAMEKVHVYTSLCAPTISQEAATEALRGSQKFISKTIHEYDRRRKLVIKRLSEMGLPCVEPKGAFYAFPRISKYGKTSLNFCKWLIKKAGVLTVPGSEFGSEGEGFIRLSYATSYEIIKKAMDKLASVL